MQDIKDDNDGVSFLLVVINLFSRYLWVRPLKTKSAREVTEAFEDIFDVGQKPEKLRTDKGKEFTNNDI